MIGFEYRQFVRRMGTKEGVFLPASVSALGLCGEANEAAQCTGGDVPSETFLKELSDVAFYLTALAEEFGIQDNALESYPGAFLSLETMDQAAGRMVASACEIAEMVKKLVWSNKQPLPGEIDIRLADIIACIQAMALRRGSSFDDVLRLNEQKLTARWRGGAFLGHGKESK